MEGALENLQKLAPNYALFLVTAGHVQTQSKKVKATQTEKYFQKVYTINGAAQQRKSLAFNEILSNLKLKPTELLSIGNRLAQEIHDAKELGALTCYFRFGEHVGEEPRNSFEIPDFVVESHKELIQTCRL
jgi:FMN phosphatase YigB (HAD superfamily)